MSKNRSGADPVQMQSDETESKDKCSASTKESSKSSGNTKDVSAASGTAGGGKKVRRGEATYGCLLRKRPDSLTIAAVEKTFCYDRNIALQGEVCATWLPAREHFFEGEEGEAGFNKSSAGARASTGPGARTARKAVFFTPEMCQQFLRQMRDGEACAPDDGDSPGGALGMRSMGSGSGEGASGVLQEFVVPAGASNFVVRALEQQLAPGLTGAADDVSLAIRTNRYTRVPRKY